MIFQDIPPLAIEHFHQRVEVRGPGECWPWLGKKTLGYGYLIWRGKRFPATRLSWVLSNKKDWPERKLACHTCDNPPCVNPAHIWPGTHAENAADMVAKGRHRNGFGANRTITHCKRGHAYEGQPKWPSDKGRVGRCVLCARFNQRLRYRRLKAEKARAALAEQVSA